MGGIPDAARSASGTLHRRMLGLRQSVRWLPILALAWPLVGAAQAERCEREVEVTGAPDERPTVAYGAPNVPLTLVFEAPLQIVDGGVVVVLPGADVRPHPFDLNALIITPSRSLAGRGSVPLRVPLVTRVA